MAKVSPSGPKKDLCGVEAAARAGKMLVAKVLPPGPGIDLDGGEAAARAVKMLVAKVLPEQISYFNNFRHRSPVPWLGLITPQP